MWSNGSSGIALLGKAQQQLLHLRAQINENANEASGSGKLQCLLQRCQRRDGLPLRCERHSTQGQDLDPEARTGGALGKLIQRPQDIKRHLHIRRCTLRQEDLCLRQVRVLQPVQQPIWRRRRVRLHPAQGFCGVPLGHIQLGAQ